MPDHDNVLRKPSHYAFHDPRRAVVRLVAAMIVGALVAALAPRGIEWHVRTIMAWDASALVLTALAWVVITRADEKETAKRAGSHDPGRNMVWVIALTSCFASFFAALFLIRKGHASDAYAGVRIGLALAAVLLSWVLTHTTYTLRYAHLYYGRIEGGGLEFPGGKHPRDADFAYFAFTLGMCFQTSDVTVTSWRIRRTVLVHALVSFAYNTMILALALNIAFGLLG